MKSEKGAIQKAKWQMLVGMMSKDAHLDDALVLLTALPDAAVPPRARRTGWERGEEVDSISS